MSLLPPDPPPHVPDRLRTELARTTERLRTMSLVRLAAPLPDGLTRAAAAVALAQHLADRAAELGGEPCRSLPELPISSAGDVLAVCGHDLLRTVVDRGEDPAAAAACADAVARLLALRRDL